MGEARKDALRLNFDHKLKLEFHGTKVTSDAGLLAYRELDEALGLTSAIDSELRDNRTGKNTRHSIAALLRQSIYSRLAGYEDTNDAERLCVDPAMRHVAGGRAIERSAASTSLMGRFETEILTQSENLGFLMDLPGVWVDKVHQRKLLKQIILDMDSSVSPTYGNQEGTAYNGYFQCTCYHPLFCFNQYGDLERALLRNGNVHSADDWRSLLEPIVNRYRGYDILRFFRGDAAFADPKMYRYIEAEDYFYAIRLIGNTILHSKIEHLMTRPVGRPPKKPIVLYHSFRYQAASWDIPRRVVAKIEWYAGELFPKIGFIVTNLRWKSSNVVKFYNKRGTAEQWIKEGKYALNWTRLSCHDFVDNQVRLQLFALAYNLGNFLRRLALPNKIRDWSLRTLQVKLIKIGAKVVKHSRYVIFQMAEVMVSKSLFHEILERIGHLKPVPIGYG
ncbi:MAG: IS1380 family transposase [Planctomycetes bacterium]|nr:IS1380 family transposase [Planctomycetota bacterium]